LGGEARRKSPEEFLREAQAEEAAANRRGHLKIFLGYASGVGKTVRMLDEARRRRERGQDVVIGAVQPQAPPQAGELLKQLEVIPLKAIGGSTAIDVGAILRRRPAICIIDGLAYDNPPGAGNSARWQDVRDLVDAGLKVIGSINIQYVAELSKEVEPVTGKHVTQTVPVSFVMSADEIEIVDAPSESPQPDSVAEPLDGTRARQGLAKLREMALVLAADVVDHQLSEYLGRQGIHQHSGGQERILVCITPRANVEEMIQTAQIIADRFHGELLAAYVNQPQISAGDPARLEEKLAVARAAGARPEILEGDDPIATLVDFARSRGVTQLFIGHSQQTGLWSRFVRSPVDRLIGLSRGMDVRIFPQ
jgi:two-component system sensor histidine kinase KdpD